MPFCPWEHNINRPGGLIGLGSKGAVLSNNPAPLSSRQGCWPWSSLPGPPWGSGGTTDGRWPTILWWAPAFHCLNGEGRQAKSEWIYLVLFQFDTALCSGSIVGARHPGHSLRSRGRLSSGRTVVMRSEYGDFPIS